MLFTCLIKRHVLASETLRMRYVPVRPEGVESALGLLGARFGTGCGTRRDLEAFPVRALCRPSDRVIPTRTECLRIVPSARAPSTRPFVNVSRSSTSRRVVVRTLDVRTSIRPGSMTTGCVPYDRCSGKTLSRFMLTRYSHRLVVGPPTVTRWFHPLSAF